MATTYTAKELARAVETDPKTFRRFLREHLRGQDIETPGQGGRYNFSKGEAKSLMKAYKVWAAPKVKAPKIVESDEVELDGEETSDLVAALEASIAAAEAKQGGLTDSSEDEDEDEDEDDVEPEIEEDEDDADVEPEDFVTLGDPDEDELEEIELEA